MNKQVAGARKFRIVIIIDAWYPIIGGGQVHVWEISKRIVKNEDVYVEIVTRKLKNEEGELFNKDEYSYNGKLKIKRLGLTSHWNNFFVEVTYLIHLIIYLLINKYDLIHVQPFLPALPGKLVSLIRNKPLIVTVHGTRLFESNQSKTLDIWLERVILTKIKYNLQISVTRAFLNIKNINKEKVVIPNGLDLKRFNQIKAKKNSPTQILWVGRFDSIKRVSDLIYAMKILNSKNATLKLKLVGYGYKINEIKDLIKINRVSNIEVAGLKIGQELINEYKNQIYLFYPHPRKDNR
jgi:glycosyltransferase involved in cell wall biosynthesis